MSAIVSKVIEALRDMAAKVDETVEREEVDIERVMGGYRLHGDREPTRKVVEHRYDRSWLSGRLLGMADAIEAIEGSGRNLADATSNHTEESK
jgi:hypothetical protein